MSKTAKEMFEELGFYEETSPMYENCIWYKTKDSYWNRELKFYKKDKLIYNNLVYGGFTMNGSCPLYPKLLQVINQQVKELGWEE